MGVDARANVFYGFRYEDLDSWEARWEIQQKLEYDDSEQDEDDHIKTLLPEGIDPDFFGYPNNLESIYPSYYSESDPVGFGVRLAWMDWDITEKWEEITTKVQFGLATHRITTDLVLDSLGIPKEIRGTFVQCYMG